MKKEKPYTISRLQNVKEEVYYVHKTGFPNVPVFGSFGTKKKAKEICKIYNRSVGR